MVLDHAENLIATDTDADIASGDTTISVVDASVFPDPASVGDYNVTIDDAEIVRLTAIDTTNNDLTVTRGQENTSAQSFTAPVSVEFNPTAKQIRDIDTLLEAIADFAASPTEVTAPVNNDSVDTQSIFSESLPTLVRLERVDASTAKAYDREQDTLIASGNHATVIQAAIDHVRSNYGDDVTNTSYPALHNVKTVGAIDGGYQTFVCDSQIQLKDQIKLKNIDLDFNGNSISNGLFGFGFGVVAEPAGSNIFVENLQLENFYVRNVGSGGGARFVQPSWGVLDNCLFEGNSGAGHVMVGAVGMRSHRCRYINNGSDGCLHNDTSEIDGNYNFWTFCDFFNNPTNGLALVKSNVTTDECDVFWVRNCNFQSNGLDGLKAEEYIRTLQVVENWFEASSTLRIGTDNACDYARVARNKVQSIEIGNSAGSEIVGNYTETGGSLDITVTSNATDTRLRDNVLVNGSVTDNGTRTVRNGEASETANAEQPQAAYPRPTFVDFTDSGDGSGDGLYYVDGDGTVHGPI